MNPGYSQGLALGAWTPLANNPTEGFPNPAEEGIITEDGDFLITENNEYIVTE